MVPRRTAVLREHLREALGGIVARAVALGGAPLEDHPDPLEHPPRGCRAREPLRPKRRQNVGARDGIHALRPEGRYHARERGQPLLTVFLVPEPSRVRRVDLSGRLLERREPTMRTPTLREGIAAGPGHLPKVHGLLPGLRERDQGHAAEPEVAPAALNDRAQNPALRAARGHAEIQAAAVGHPASACPRSSRLHRAGGESLVRMALGEVPHIYPHYNPDCVGSEECVWDD